MYNFEFFYYPGKYLNYLEMSKLISEIKNIASYEGKNLPDPARDFLKEKILLVARKNGRAHAYRLAEFVKIPHNISVLCIQDVVSTPAVNKNDINYQMLSLLIKNIVLRFRLFSNTYVCCTNSNFFDAMRFEDDFYDVFPTIAIEPKNRVSYTTIIEYLISNRQDILDINDISEVDRKTYFINNNRLIQIGRINAIKCIINLFVGKDYSKSNKVLTSDNII